MTPFFMEKGQIIAELYGDKRVDECIVNICEPGCREDIKQDLFLVLLGKEDGLIKDLYEQKVLFFYAVRVIMNLSSMARKSKRPAELPAELCEEKQEDPTAELMAVFEAMEMNAENGFPYHKTLVSLIAKYGSQREVARRTGIPLMTISDSVKQVRTYIKSKL